MDCVRRWFARWTAAWRQPGRHARPRCYGIGDDLAIVFDLVLFAVWAFVICATLAAGGTP